MESSDSFESLRRAGLQPPSMLTFALTGACNLRCLHCWVGAGSRSSAPHVPRETVLRLIEEFAALGGEGVRLTGGEPLCHPDWLEFMRFARTRGVGRIALQTNAILFGDDEILALSELDFSGFVLQISLDGAVAATHDRVRGEGAFAGVMDAIERFARRDLAVRISISFTEMQHNLEEFPDVLELAERFGIGSVSAGTLVACGRGAQKSFVAPPGTQQYVRLLDRYESDPRFRSLYERLGNMAVIDWLVREVPDAHSQGCAFIENPYLTADGKFYPCVLCHADSYAVSNVFDKSLADVLIEGALSWSGLRQRSRIRAATLMQCQECPGFRDCAGGCMGRAWGSSADFMATDDRCAVRQMVYRRKHLTPLPTSTK